MSKSSVPFPSPPAAEITVTRDDGDVAILFPPRGVLRTYRGQLVFSIAFSVVLAFVGIGLGLITPAQAGPVLRWALVAPLTAAGLYLIASTINRGRRTTRVVAGQSGLAVEVAGPFFSSRRSWARSQIDSVMLRGYQSVCVTTGGRDVRVPLDRSRAEALWLVAVVRSALGMPPQGSRRPLLPAGSTLSWSKEGDNATIIAPAERTSVVVFAFCVPMLCLLCVCLWEQYPGHGPASLLVILVVHAAMLTMLLLELGRRTRSPVTFCVSPRELLVTRSTLLGRSRLSWTRDQIEDVVANSAIVYVVLRRKRRKAVGFMLHAGFRDVKWVAETIRHEMKLLGDARERKSGCQSVIITDANSAEVFDAGSNSR